MSINNTVNYTITATDLISGKLDTIDKNTEKTKNGMGALGGVIAGAFAIGIVEKFVRGVIDAGTKVQDATTGLTTLLGDSSEAARVVKNTMEDASSSPFAFEGLLDANKALIGAGINADLARKDILNLSNAIAATGGGDDELKRMSLNMQQIKNTGKASATDIKQFASAGVNIYEVIARATGKSAAEASKMTVSYDLLAKSLEVAHDKGGIYYKGLENMSGNTSVIISSVGDKVFEFYNTMFEVLEPVLNSVLLFVGDLISGAIRIIKWFKEGGTAVTIIKNALKILIPVIGGYITVIKLQAMYTKAAAVSQAILNAVMDANPIGLVVAAIAALVAIVYVIIEAWDEWGAALSIILGPLGLVVSAVMSIYRHWDSITKAFKEDGIIAGFKRLGVVIFDAVLYPMQKVSEIIGKWTGAKWINEMSANIKAYRKSLDLITPEETAKEDAKLEGKKDKKGEKAKPDPTDKLAKSNVDKVSGTKLTTINISIGSLIKEMSFKTTNLKESSDEIRSAVVNALTNALADSQIIVK